MRSWSCSASTRPAADRTVEEMRSYLAADVPVGEHLADQLLLLFALAGSGACATVPPSGHTVTQIDLIPRFLDVPIQVEETGGGRHVVRVGPAARGSGLTSAADRAGPSS